jgi:DNA ligase-1
MHMLAMDFKGQNLAGFYASEKMDGHRAMWDGTKFLSRTGLTINLPQCMTRNLPSDLKLDGELWSGRGKFQDCSVLRRKDINEGDISRMKFVVFDSVSDLPFELRLRDAQRAVTASRNLGNTYLEMVEYTIVNNTTEAIATMTELCRNGAEGLMLRSPGSFYEAKRSKHLLKLKPIDIGEAVLVGKVSDKQSYMMRDTKTNTVFNVRSIKKMNLGDATVYFYNGLTPKGLPRFPRLSSTDK